MKNETIKIGPETWTKQAPYLLTVFHDAESTKVKKYAADEIKKMARIADLAQDAVEELFEIKERVLNGKGEPLVNLNKINAILDKATGLSQINNDLP